MGGADQFDIRFDRGRALLDAGNADAALRAGNDAYALAGNDAARYTALDLVGDACWAKRDVPGTRAVGEAMLELYPEGVLGLIQLARAALADEDYRTFDRATAAALAADPDNVYVMKLVGIRWRVVGGYETAEAWARHALDLRPDDPDLMGDLALVLVCRERMDEARSLIERMLAIDPDSASAFAVAAVAAYDQSRFAAAATFASLALERDPADDDSRTILQRAQVFGHALMKPFWAIQSIHPGPAAMGGLMGIAGAFPLLRTGLLTPVLIAGGIYFGLCFATIGWVEARTPSAPKRRPDFQLKDF